MSDKKVVILHESPLMSVLHDVVSYGMLIGLFLINKFFLDSLMPSWILFVIFILITLVKGTATKYTVKSYGEAIVKIEEIYKKTSNNL